MGATLTGDDDVAVLETDAGVAARPVIPIAPIARRAFEPSGKPQSVPFGDPAGESDVLACGFVVAVRRGRRGQGV